MILTDPTVRLNLLTACCLAALPSLAAAAGGHAADWKAYARSSMTPDFDWAVVQPVGGAERSAVDPRDELRAATRQALASWRSSDRLSLQFSVGSLGQSLRAGRDEGVLTRNRVFNTEQANTSLTQRLDANSDVELTAIIARSRYATPGMGTSRWQAVEQFTGVRQSGIQEVSEGGAVALALHRALSDEVMFSVAMQSRLDMDPFKSYRGIYSEAGDFDLPGHVRGGVEWAVTNRFALGVDVQRMMYSDVDTFTSSLLPTSFLALLGDGSSPEFAWRDLTVYSAEAAMLDDFGGRWSLRYSTQLQPRPTSALLSQALAEQYSDLNLGFAYRRRIGAAGEFQLAASYAPEAYFLASAPFVQRDFDGGSQVEVEAQWSLSF